MFRSPTKYQNIKGTQDTTNTNITTSNKKQTSNTTVKNKIIKNQIVSDTDATNINEIVPNELKITINTSIPGFQKLLYKPSMTVKDTKEKNVWFNPLVELDPSVINDTPDSFSDGGLFLDSKVAIAHAKQMLLDDLKRHLFLNR